MVKLSDQQKSVIGDSLKNMAVVACAGSGKTATAVERLYKMCSDLEQSRSRVALLSFSNIAVNTFRKACHGKSKVLGNGRIAIDTFDGFITSNILRPHAYRTMGCNRVPFLVNGSEPFLKNDKFKYWYEASGRNRSVEGWAINDIAIGFRNKNFEFYYRYGDLKYTTNNGSRATKSLGEIGAYTHELGKYWSLKTLVEQPKILCALANRYPHIIVDEAQDIGELHQYILELLLAKGVCVTLIGDPNQAIYEFAGATGEFLSSFYRNPKNISHDLSTNFRSVPKILEVANSISNRLDNGYKKSTNSEYGAYYLAYDPKNQKPLVESFYNKLKKSGLSETNSAILCRGNAGVENLRVASKNIGQGKVKLLVLAAIHRDANADFQKAFKFIVGCVVSLLENAPENLSTMIVNSNRHPEVRGICQDIWLFVRSSDTGLPSASLKASTVWHELVKTRLIALLDKIVDKYGYTKVGNIGAKLSKKGLVDEPLILDSELDLSERPLLRVDTVHQAKGESLDAVLYVANKSHIEAVLDGVTTEVGRIGYVAITRAESLFMLGVPKSALNELAPRLEKIGLKKL